MIRRYLGLATILCTSTAIAIGCGSDDEGSGGGSDMDGGLDASAQGGSGNTGGTGTGASAGTGGTTPTGGTGGTGGTTPTGGTGGTPDARSPEQTGDSCTVPADCYPNIDHSTLSGDVECLDRVQDGYCTHQCDTDDDCCAAPGECQTDLRQVCAPFENTGLRLCFLSCEDADIRAPLLDSGILGDGAAFDAAVLDITPNEYCAEEAHPDFICRSTGGGAANRRVCVPGGVAGDGGPIGDGGGGPPPDDAGTMDASMDGSMGMDGATDASDAATD